MLYQISHGAVAFADDVILHDINFEIRNTEKIAVVGRNGCGKTTLLRISADLLTPTQGRITVGGESPHAARLKQRYGIVFQSPPLPTHSI